MLQAQRDVEVHVVGVGSLDGLQLVLVKDAVGVGEARQQPELVLVALLAGQLVVEEAAPEGAEGGDARAGGDAHDGALHVILRQQHGGAGGAGHDQLIAGLDVADVVGAQPVLGLASDLVCGRQREGTGI